MEKEIINSPSRENFISQRRNLFLKFPRERESTESPSVAREMVEPGQVVGKSGLHTVPFHFTPRLTEAPCPRLGNGGNTGLPAT